MSKFLLLVLVGVALYLVLTRAKKAPPGKDGASPPAAETMIQCAHCHVHLPLGESLAAGGKRYCSEEHRRLDQG